MNGREDRKQNDLFFVCSLIEYVARKTKNERKIIVNALGHTGLEHFYDLAEVYHCENIDKVTSEIINIIYPSGNMTMWLKRKTTCRHIGI